MVAEPCLAPCSTLLGQRVDAARIGLGASLSVGSQVTKLFAALLGGLRLPVSSSCGMASWSVAHGDHRFRPDTVAAPTSATLPAELMAPLGVIVG